MQTLENDENDLLKYIRLHDVAHTETQNWERFMYVLYPVQQNWSNTFGVWNTYDCLVLITLRISLARVATHHHLRYKAWMRRIDNDVGMLAGQISGQPSARFERLSIDCQREGVAYRA